MLSPAFLCIIPCFPTGILFTSQTHSLHYHPSLPLGEPTLSGTAPEGLFPLQLVCVNSAPGIPLMCIPRQLWAVTNQRRVLSADHPILISSPPRGVTDPCHVHKISVRPVPVNLATGASAHDKSPCQQPLSPRIRRRQSRNVRSVWASLNKCAVNKGEGESKILKPRRKATGRCHGGKCRMPAVGLSRSKTEIQQKANNRSEGLYIELRFLQKFLSLFSMFLNSNYLSEKSGSVFNTKRGSSLQDSRNYTQNHVPL